MRVAIVEDDEPTRKQLLSYLKRYEEEKGTAVQVETFSDGIYFAEKYEYDTMFDVILLDIEMEQLDGMKTAEQIREKDENVVIIFITNMAQFAVEGYRVRALDFVVKPVNYFIFSEKIKKAERKNESRMEKFVIVKSREHIYKIHTKDIIYIEVKNHELTYHLTTTEYTCRGNLKKIEKELEKLAFARCSVSFLVHLTHIKKLEKGQLLMDNGDVLPIGRTRYTEFMNALTDYYGGRGTRDV